MIEKDPNQRLGINDLLKNLKNINKEKINKNL